ncbi:putative membrane protein [Volucribacter psittacicida]|uniref:Putative membrane protein n=1 Tax=Volucribacter psittacicida TaxID=203482 RepID=A0A4R1G547_9PAST|nr:hypothetical protein [Volucribacter psittacicida]TCK01535.1 putative membrane protein [Volucribacter psittacicida]
MSTSTPYLTLVNLFLFFTSACYPVIWLINKTAPSLSYLPWGLGLLWLIKGIITRKQQSYFAYLFAIILFVTGLNKTNQIMYWYPVIINAFMLILFAGSLFTSQSFVERIARLSTPHLNAKGIIYTYRVTLLWCLIFSFNLLIITFLIMQENYQYWAYYTGVISYVIIAIVMLSEWLIRQRVKKQHEE